jgi:translation initiation factor 3 subunit H
MNFAAALTEVRQTEIEEARERLEVVEIDGLAVLKIVKHCKEYLPQLVTGQLLGLDFDNMLEVTNCFPFPSRPAEGEMGEDYDDSEGAEYQIDMMRSLREVNVDNNTVGWYQSTYLGSHITENLIATQYNYQESIPKCVCLIFDPLKTAQGNLALKAVRLTDSFLALYKGGEFTLDSILKSGVCAEDIFEELPIQVRNSNLIKAFLLQMDRSQIKRSVSADVEDSLTTNPFLEKNLECLIESIDDLSQESSRFQYHQRALSRHTATQNGLLAKRKAENEQRRRQGLPPVSEDDLSTSMQKPPPEPSRLDSLLFNTQISNYCQQINQFCGQSFNKHFLINALRHH